MNELQRSSYLLGGATYLEELYEQFLQDPNSVENKWRDYFKTLPEVNGAEGEVSHANVRQQFLNLAKQSRIAVMSTGVAHEHKQDCVVRYMNSYRRFGHLAAKLDPLGSKRPPVVQLELTRHDLSENDLDNYFCAPTLMNTAQSILREIRAALVETYCSHIGAEYMHINNQEEVDWIQKQIESTRAKPQFDKEKKLKTLQLLTAADGIEKYLGSKYVGQKRFSLEGGDSFIPMLHEITRCSGKLGIQSCVIGMAHRGRLNVLINIMGQSSGQLFQEFEGKKDYGLTSGDVKYHFGFSSDIETDGGPMHLSLAYNPSHLEVIASVVLGSVRARQHRFKDFNHSIVLPIIVHGDAAMAGQGIIMETVNMSETHAYYVGGAIHIAINNQIGFTTSDPQDARSGIYCTDIAKMIDAPIFHVNADDPEACLFVSELAVDYRERFHKDVFIDLVCYRLFGHNEADEPAATQPLMYEKIRRHSAPRQIYAQQLIKEGICDQAYADKLWEEYHKKMENGEQVVETIAAGRTHQWEKEWKPYIDQDWRVPCETTFSKNKLINLAKKMLQLPKDFTLQRQVALIMAARSKMAAGEQLCDWGFAENLAYASLLDEGHSIRFSGQDSQRGTFAHRHAVLHDQKTGEEYTPLHHLANAQGRFEIYNSLLSEEGVVGFEFGYAGTDPHNLVIWEAQFGDFANGAQVIIDQFISSSWQKWKRLCGLVMLLPHGYEGLGPEHSSARLERYLQLCAQNNIQVCVPTTPAQIFHLLRRQILRTYRTPLIVMSPKSLLRHKLAVSSLDELATGHFQLVIPEIDNNIDRNQVKKVIICSGKVYYDIFAKRQELECKDTAILRLEQLYPFPYEELRAELAKYPHAKRLIWCQEEPKNQGAWFITRHRLERCKADDQTLEYAGRRAAASPAVGYAALHKQQQAELVE